MLLRTLFAFLVVSLAGPVAAACPPPAVAPDEARLAAAARTDRGPLWRLERDGRVSWLYGTLHVGRPEWAAPGPAVRAALAASDVLALEIDTSDPAVGLGLVTPGTAAAPLPAPLRERLARQVRAACLPDDALAALPPALQVTVLALLESRWAGLDTAYAQETVLSQLARAAGRPVVGLETVAQQMRALVPDDAGAAERLIDSTLTQLESGSGRAIVERMARAWEQGDLRTLEDYERWCDCARTEDERAALRALNDDRNPGLADGIEALHAKGQRVFAAVGALHMAGPKALPKLLAARGFRVQRSTMAR